MVFVGEPAAVNASATLTDYPWLLEQTRTNKTVIIPDVSALPEPAQTDRQRLLSRGVTNLVSIPWCTAPDRLDGVVFFASTRWRKLDPATVSQLETLSRTILVVLSRARERRATAEARERMRTQLEMLDDAPAGITINTRGKFLYANKQAAVMHGCTPEEFVKLTIPELVAPEDRGRIAALRQAIVEHGLSFLHHLASAQGRDAPAPGRAKSRQSTWLGHDVNICVFVDLSERERAERELRSERGPLSRAGGKNISDVISILDLESEPLRIRQPFGAATARIHGGRSRWPAASARRSAAESRLPTRSAASYSYSKRSGPAMIQRPRRTTAASCTTRSAKTAVRFPPRCAPASCAIQPAARRSC